MARSPDEEPPEDADTDQNLAGVWRRGDEPPIIEDLRNLDAVHRVHFLDSELQIFVWEPGIGEVQELADTHGWADVIEGYPNEVRHCIPDKPPCHHLIYGHPDLTLPPHESKRDRKRRRFQHIMETVSEVRGGEGDVESG